MKIRIGFVSNSSSSSFVVALSKLTWDQIRLIQEFKGDAWSFSIVGDELHGFTSMDNGMLGEYLEKIGVNQTRVRIENDG